MKVKQMNDDFDSLDKKIEDILGNILNNKINISTESDEISEKQKIYLYSPNGLVDFYKDETNKNILISIVKQKTSISLRLLDWLITNYAKNYGVFYTLDYNTYLKFKTYTSYDNKSNSDSEYIPSTKFFDLWDNYKNQLTHYSKNSLDPFCRGRRIFFNCTDNTIEILKTHMTKTELKEYNKREDGILTTVGQLNFFRWAITYKIIDYAFDHLNEIESDMLDAADKRLKNNSKDYKDSKVRHQLSKNNNSARAHKVNITLQFQ